MVRKFSYFDEIFFDQDVFDYLDDTTLLEEIKVDFENTLNQDGHDVVWRQKSYTIDSAHGVPTAEGSPTDTTILAFLLPNNPDNRGLNRENSEFTSGKMKLFTLATNKVLEGDFIIDANEAKDGFTSVTGTSASQVVLSGDKRPDFNVNDYITIDDANNDNYYKITAVSYSAGNDETTLTVAFDSDPGTGDTVYKTNVYYVRNAGDWPSNKSTVFRRALLELRK